MKYIRHITALLIPLVLGALFFHFSMRPRQNPALQLANPTPDDYIAGWRDMGMWLPDQQEVQFFATRLDVSRDLLCAALSHADYSVRMRAAYVIGMIEGEAKGFGPSLISQLRHEPDVLVRIYIVNALNSIESKDVATIAELCARYDSLDSTNVPGKLWGHAYSEVDEKITIAAALYRLLADDDKAKYYAFVTDWLKTPPDEMRGFELDGYWERRWMAVNVLERMPGAVSAIPMLESLRDEPNAKSWVHVHVPRVLAALGKKQ